MIRTLFRLRRVIVLAAVIGAVAPSLTTASQKLKNSNVNSWLTGLNLPSTLRNVLPSGDDVSLNPQPLPPQVRQTKNRFRNTVSLNPQRLPPRVR
jgi:hypothetical protein